MISRIINKITCLMIKIKYKKTISFTKLIARQLTIRNNGIANSIQIAEHCNINNCIFLFHGNNNTIIIGDRVKLDGVTFWIEDNNNVINIGRKCTFETGTQLAACEGTKIIIGEDCMFSNNIFIRTTDSHSILDKNNNRINKSKDIRIGNHVWVGLQSLILKGSIVGDNSIIGARSVVSSSSPHFSNCIIAGHPVKIIRSDINWSRDRI